MGLKDASPVIERHRGFHEVMKNYPGIKVVTLESNWKLERAQELMKQYLDKGGHADGVFGHSDLGAIGAFLERLCLVYSAIVKKPQSDYNRNIYLDLQEQARQDKQLEALRSRKSCV